MNLTYTIESIDQIAQQLIDKIKQEPLPILFEGEMGAGKTTLIKAMVKALDSQDRVSSPTFSLVNEYHSQSGPIFHFDFYRINHEEEAYDIGFEEYLNQDSWCFIEWPQKITNLLPEKHYLIKIMKKNEFSRALFLDKK